MNHKVVCSFLAGLGIGGIIGYFVERKILQKKGDEILQETTNEISDAYAKAIKDVKEKLEAERDIWNQKYQSGSKDPEEPEKPEEPVKSPAPEERDGEEMEVYAIGLAPFMQDAGYLKKYLGYYRADDMLVNQGSGEEVDRYYAIGDMADLLPDYGGNIMYIRNEKNKTDYEVDFDNGGYDPEVPEE